jgi:hypothetical protein
MISNHESWRFQTCPVPAPTERYGLVKTSVRFEPCLLCNMVFHCCLYQSGAGMLSRSYVVVDLEAAPAMRGATFALLHAPQTFARLERIASPCDTKVHVAVGAFVYLEQTMKQKGVTLIMFFTVFPFCISGRVRDALPEWLTSSLYHEHIVSLAGISRLVMPVLWCFSSLRIKLLLCYSGSHLGQA